MLKLHVKYPIVNGGGVENAEIINGVLDLEVGNFYVNMEDSTVITLPGVTEYAEIRLWFKCDTDLTIIFPNIAWQNEPETIGGYIYEYIFTYVNGDWVGGFVSYEMAGDN